MPRPETKLRDTSHEMLVVVFDPDSTDEEVAMATTTLIEIIAPDILRDAMALQDARTPHNEPREQ